MNLSLSPRNKLIVVAAICAVVIIGVGVALILPTYSKISVLNGQMDTAEKEYVSAKTLLEQRYQVKNQAAQTDARLIQLAVAVPENPDLPSLIIDLEDTAYQAGVVLRSVRPNDPVPPEEGGGYMGLPIDMEVWGSWSDSIDFIDRLSKMPRQLRINSFDVKLLSPPAPEEKASYGLSFPPYYQVSSSVKVTAYVIPAASAPASAAVPPVGQ